MWSSSKDIKMKSPVKKTLKNSTNATKIPISFNKGQRVNPELLQILTEESFERVQDNSGLLKLYLKLLREALVKQKIYVSQKKWMKIFKILKLVAYTRSVGDRKRICLTDCFLIPYLVAKSKNEFNISEQINLDLLENLTRIYGSQRLVAVLENHFWLLKWQKSQIKEIRKRHLNLPSFFNGCLSHPETYQMISDSLDIGLPQIYYSCSGGDRKILSDEYIQVDPQKPYELKIELRTSDEMILYVGLVCFDANREFIHSTQVNRVEGSHVTVEGDSDAKCEIYVTKDTQDNLKLWNSFNPDQKDKAKSFSYLRSIGVYDDGDINKFITLDRVLQDTVSPYGDTEENGIFSRAAGNTIKMTKAGYEKYLALKQKNAIQLKKTVLMNHFEGGTYAFAECFDEYIKKWITKSYWFKGESRGTETNKFRKGTKYVKIVILSNYNSGFPDFKIVNKDASVFWKNTEFKILK